MSVCADALEELMSLGVTGPALVAAIRRLEQAAYGDRIASLEAAVEKASSRADEELKSRRERDRDRKRAQRVRGIPGTSADGADSDEAKDVSPAPPSENTPIPPLKGGTFPAENPQPPEKPKGASAELAADEPTRPRSARRRPSRPIPDGFPTDDLIEVERSKAWLEGIDLDATREAAKFRNHAQSTDRRCADWAAAWRNWTLKAREWAPKLTIVANPATDPDPWPGRLIRWRKAQYWDSDWGPKPGCEGYRGPPIQDRAA